MLSLPEILEARSEWSRREKFLNNCKDQESFPKYFHILSWYNKQIAIKYEEAIEEGVFDLQLTKQNEATQV